MDHSIDKRTVIKLKRGNADAFRSIYNMFSSRIFHFCNRLLPTKNDAEDVVQKTFMALWEQRGQLDETKDILKYIYSIARYNTYLTFRKLITLQEQLSENADIQQLSQNNTLEEIDFNETHRIISEIIDKLPPKRREIFKLNRLDGLTYREIAVKLNISENTVDTQMRKSLQFLKEQYHQYLSE